MTFVIPYLDDTVSLNNNLTFKRRLSTVSITTPQTHIGESFFIFTIRARKGNR